MGTQHILKNNKVKENFELKTMNRKELKEAPYNPRRIDDNNRKNLKKYLKKAGLLLPPVNWNKRTGRMIGGHQRLQIMDLINQTDDYELTVVVNDLSEKEEVEANVKLNSQNLSGEYDPGKLYNLKLDFPEIDFEKDLAFKEEELDLIFSDLSIEVQENYEEDGQQYSEYQQANMEKLKETKEKYKKRMEQENKDGGTIYTRDDDYSVTFIFRNNSEKKQFMRDVRQKQHEKFLKSEILFQINKGDFQLTISKND